VISPDARDALEHIEPLIRAGYWDVLHNARLGGSSPQDGFGALDSSHLEEQPPADAPGVGDALFESVSASGAPEPSDEWSGPGAVAKDAQSPGLDQEAPSQGGDVPNGLHGKLPLPTRLV
jgi:hypothetical protein